MTDKNNGAGHSKRSHEDHTDSSSAKRSRGMDKVEVRILIPYNTAGAIIGKGGSNIKELRQEFDSNVQIPDSNGSERVITATCKTIGNAAKLSGRILEALIERMNQRERDGIIKLLIHKSQAGTIIGLKGSRIKELRETTGANIKVNQECCPDSTDRICQIRGSTETVVVAIKIVLELLQEAPPKGPIHNYNPDFYDDSYDYGGYNRFDRDGPPSDRGRRGGFRGGRTSSGPRSGFRGRDGYDQGDFGGGGDYGGRDRRDQGGYQQERSRFGGRGAYGGYDDDGYDDYPRDDYNDSYDQGGYMDDRGGYDDVNDDAMTTQVTIPTELAGSIIGKGGKRIKQIRQDSGAMIELNEPDPACEDRIITIVGTNAQTQNAQYLLQKCVKLYSGDRY